MKKRLYKKGDKVTTCTGKVLKIARSVRTTDYSISYRCLELTTRGDYPIEGTYLEEDLELYKETDVC